MSSFGLINLAPDLDPFISSIAAELNVRPQAAGRYKR